MEHFYFTKIYLTKSIMLFEALSLLNEYFNQYQRPHSEHPI